MTFERKKLGGVRMCQRCLRSKPDRCHHCSQCNSCILKMDHHCPWIANCVGFANYKYFLNMLFYTSVCTLQIWTQSLWILKQVLVVETVNPFMTYYVSMSFMLAFTLWFIISGFMTFHFWLISKSYTTIEFCEKKGDKNSGFNVSPYDLGFYRNFKKILGPNPLFWFVPTSKFFVILF